MKCSQASFDKQYIYVVPKNEKNKLIELRLFTVLDVRTQKKDSNHAFVRGNSQNCTNIMKNAALVKFN